MKHIIELIKEEAEFEQHLARQAILCFNNPIFENKKEYFSKDCEKHINNIKHLTKIIELLNEYLEANK